MVNKMKSITLFVIFLLPLSSFAKNEVQIVSAHLMCLDKESDRYNYGIQLVLKNISNNEIVLITKTNGAAISPEFNGRPAEISIGRGESKIGNTAIIPTNEKLGLVTLRQNEATQVINEFSSEHNIQTAIIQYSATKIYNNHFNNWSGSVRSNKVKTFKRKSCKP